LTESRLRITSSASARHFKRGKDDYQQNTFRFG
jgi:hypothetical protein